MCATARSCGRNEIPPRTVDVLGGIRLVVISFLHFGLRDCFFSMFFLIISTSCNNIFTVNRTIFFIMMFGRNK